MIQLATTAEVSNDGDIILDFFAGSGTTAQAVLELNREDGGNRKFILVQLPEPIPLPASPLKGEEQKTYPTIAHITRERVRRVIGKLKGEGQIPPSPPFSKGGIGSAAVPKLSPMESLFADEVGDVSLPPLRKGGGGDLGFRAFTLSSSNFKIWHTDQAPATAEALAEQLKLYADNVDRQRNQQDILFELILKSGLPLSSRIEKIALAIASLPLQGGGQEGDGVSAHAFSIADGSLLICLENPISHGVLRSMMERKPRQILCLDTAFHGDDPLKTNIVLEAKAHGILFRTV